MENENTQNAGNITADSGAVTAAADMQQGAGNDVVSAKSDDRAATPMIKNPLPLPTPHTNRKEVDYDYEVPEDQMHFDIEKPNRNYYDIQ